MSRTGVEHGRIGTDRPARPAHAGRPAADDPTRLRRARRRRLGRARRRRCWPPPTRCAGCAPGTVITALGTSRGLEASLVPARGYPLELVPRVPLPRKPTPSAAAAARPAARPRSRRPRRRAGPGRAPTSWSASADTSRRRPTWPPAGAGSRSSCTRPTRGPGWPTGSAPGSRPGWSPPPTAPRPAQRRDARACRCGPEIATLDRAARRDEGLAAFGLRRGPADAAGHRRLAGRADAQHGGDRRGRRAGQRPASRCCTRPARATSCRRRPSPPATRRTCWCRTWTGWSWPTRPPTWRCAGPGRTPAPS